MTGELYPVMARKALQNDAIPNAELAKEIHPYAMVAFYFMLAVNTIAMILSFKCLRITKLYLYSCVIIHFIELFLTKDEDGVVSRQYRQIAIANQFMSCYFHFWSDTILAMLVPLMSAFNRRLFYEEPLDQGAIVAVIMSML